MPDQLAHIGLNHATCVSLDDYGVLILGQSGTGKSSLAAQLIVKGATLVADDQTDLFLFEHKLHARCAPNLNNLLELRGIGLIRVPYQNQTEVRLVVDLSHTETERMPKKRVITIGSKEIALIFGTDKATLGDALFLIMKNKTDLSQEPNV
jgi:HPr kinase/phosphorylase